MLQLQTKNADICRLSILLVKYGVKANVTDDIITIDGNITDELLENLCSNITISAVSNYEIKKIESVSENAELIQSKSDTKVAEQYPIYEENGIKKIRKDYELLFPTVKRGQIYYCDLEPVVGNELGKARRPVVVLQCDKINNVYSKTVVLICTTVNKYITSDYVLQLSPETIVDYEDSSFSRNDHVKVAQIKTAEIRTIDNIRLREYAGTIKPEIMKEMEEKLEFSLGLESRIQYVDKIVEKIVYRDNPVPEKPKKEAKLPPERRDVNMTQVQILSLVDINELLNISQENAPYKIKVEKIIKLFGFDLERNGVQYLVEAIKISPKDNYFNLETLAKLISKETKVEVEEIKRLIVARVKETLHFKKAPTIDFIRLINAFVKQEDKDYETDI